MKTKHLTVKEGDLLNIHDFPNFHKSGSIKGMKKLYYGENALLVKCGSYIFNVNQDIYDKAR